MPVDPTINDVALKAGDRMIACQLKQLKQPQRSFMPIRSVSLSFHSSPMTVIHKYLFVWYVQSGQKCIVLNVLPIATDAYDTTLCYRIDSHSIIMKAVLNRGVGI